MASVSGAYQNQSASALLMEAAKSQGGFLLHTHLCELAVVGEPQLEAGKVWSKVNHQVPHTQHPCICLPAGAHKAETGDRSAATDSGDRARRMCTCAHMSVP
jgi:hypothetical protein